MTLVDTNILLDIVLRDAPWYKRSLAALSLRSALGPLHIIDVVFAEFSVSFSSAEECGRLLLSLDINRAPMSEQALFEAGRAFVAYRRQGGVKANVLPDFFIGAQARVEGWAVLTRDARRYRTYFPQVELIAPE